jgi:hypothetical protein
VLQLNVFNKIDHGNSTMLESFNDRALRTMELAAHEAHLLNHQYVGTEHILLGLLTEEPDMLASVLGRFDLTIDAVRREIDRLIQRGPDAAAVNNLPLTPRAKRVVQLAQQEATNLNQRQVGTEHLIIALMLEPDGVAGQVLRNLGLKLAVVAPEVLKTRIAQMKIVESAVRTVPASTARKRKMREELLAHLTAIYEEEQARLHDPAAALEAAAQRFGDPRELASELACALPCTERIGFYIERCFGWRAPESAARYLLRQARLSFGLMAIICIVVAVAAGIGAGWDRSAWQAVRPAAALLLLVPLSQFVLGMLYFKLRDAMFGAFATPKSPARVVISDALIAVVVLTIAIGFIAISTWDKNRTLEMFPAACGAAVFAAIWNPLLARLRGRTEISDAMWALITLPETAN